MNSLVLATLFQHVVGRTLARRDPHVHHGPVPGPVCVACGGRLVGWGGYWRHLRDQLQVVQVWVPRRRCRSCGRTQSLLPAAALERRLDTVETIGKTVVLKLKGASVRGAAASVGLPASTVRDWLSRHQERAPALGRGLTAWAIGLGTEVGDLPVVEPQRMVAALGAALHAWHRRWPEPRVGAWRFLRLITGGRAWAANTSPLFPFSADAEMMARASPARPP